VLIFGYNLALADSGDKNKDEGGATQFWRPKNAMGIE
jgi:hypothetical protein